jgi:hypothetical protein
MVARAVDQRDGDRRLVSGPLSQRLAAGLYPANNPPPEARDGARDHDLFTSLCGRRRCRPPRCADQAGVLSQLPRMERVRQREEAVDVRAWRKWILARPEPSRELGERGEGQRVC